jgi:hypothetical protein
LYNRAVTLVGLLLYNNIYIIDSGYLLDQSAIVGLERYSDDGFTIYHQLSRKSVATGLERLSLGERAIQIRDLVLIEPLDRYTSGYSFPGEGTPRGGDA